MQTGSMKKIFMALAAAILCASCAKPDTRVPDNNCTLSTLKAFVYYDSEDSLKMRNLTFSAECISRTREAPVSPSLTMKSNTTPILSSNAGWKPQFPQLQGLK